MAFVADNSVVLAWFVKSQATPYSWTMLDRAASGEAIHVPLLWRQEFVNAMVVLERRKRLKSADATQAFRDVTELNILADREVVGLEVLAQLARRFNLGAYNASYLELAMRLRIPLACRDGPLRTALAKAGVLPA
ncbi:MAG: type II toxin-antitoxin system VapC family toxin [Burkholderiales bacterium]